MFRMPRLSRADLEWVRASGGAALLLPEDVAAPSFRIGNQPGYDRLPLSLERTFLGPPPAQNPFSPLLLSGQRVEPGFRIVDPPLGRNVPCWTTFDGKDANGCRKDDCNERRAIHRTAKDGLL